MSNIKLSGHTWDTSGVYDAEQEKTQKQVNADVSELKTAFDTVESTMTVRALRTPTWEQGAINSSGAEGNNSKRIRTKFMSVDRRFGVTINIASGYEYLIYSYSSASANAFIAKETDNWTTKTIFAPFSENVNYIRIVVRKSPETNIVPSEASNVTVYVNAMLVDDTLTVQGIPANAKTVGDIASQTTEQFEESIATITGSNGTEYTFSGITITKLANNKFTAKGTSSAANTKAFNILLGNNQTTGTQSATLTKNLSAPDVYTVVFNITNGNGEPITDNFLFAYTYGTLKQRTYLKNGDSFTVTEDLPACLFIYQGTSQDYGEDVVTVEWALYKGKDKTDYPYIEPNSLVANDKVARGIANGVGERVTQLEAPQTWGLANALANATHIADIVWTPVGNMPSTESNRTPSTPVTYFTQTQHKGIPYSSVRDQDKAVGMDVSIHTFMTAVKDPNSVLYTRLSTVTNSGTYYGAVCSGMVNYALDIDLDLTNYYLAESDMFETIPIQSIERGDMILVDGHAALITGVGKDEHGRINSVEVTEEWRPLPRVKTYVSWAGFMENRTGYIARRFKNLAGVGYTPIPYVQCFDEQAETIVYPDVQTEFGDAAVFMKGEDVKINVIDASDYTTITVKLGSTTVHTTSTIASFTLENVSEGLYTITASGGTNESVSTFFVVDATASFDDSTGDVTFSSTNATPVMVGVYTLPSNRSVSVKDIILTDEQRTAGTINVLDYMDSDYKYAKVWFMTDYGTAVWYSETHDKWTPLT